MNSQKRLDDIYARSAAKDRQTAKEEDWLKKIEAQALNDYRNKDLLGNSDLTAKIIKMTSIFLNYVCIKAQHTSLSKISIVEWKATYWLTNFWKVRRILYHNSI